MLKRNKKRFYEFEEFKKFKGLIHGISTREFGDCRKRPEKFLQALGLDKKDLILAQQVHGNKIRVVRNEDKSQIIAGVDGIITDTPGVILGIRTADCLPILFYEPEVKIIGACHAGWKGILAKLPQKMIDLMILKGALPEKILVTIGPYICNRCYRVKLERAKRFENEFGPSPKMIKSRGKDIYLDLAWAAKVQLINSGVLTKNIFNSEVCSSCQNKEFFSYRKDSQKSYGKMLTVISLIN